MSVDETTLTQYALGILNDGEAKVIQREIAASPMLQKELASIHHALQHVAQAEKPRHPNDRLRSLIMGSIQENTQYDGFVDRFATLFDLDKWASQNLLKKIDQLMDEAWQSTPFPGVKIMKFFGGPQVASATCGIVQVEAGKLFPAHQHQGNEKILVLKGLARDDKGKEFAPGDIFLSPAGSCHSFRIISDETFVFAVVLDKDNKWLLLKTLLDHLRIKK